MLRFFAIDGNDVMAFGSREGAEDYLEAYDVGSYRFFAEDGTELRLRTKNYSVIVTAEEIGRSPDYLTAALRQFLRSVPAKPRALSDVALDAASLPDLVEEMFRVGGAA
jgi:hypothetical protein